MCRHSCAGAYDSRHMGCMGSPAHWLGIHTPSGLHAQISVAPERVNSVGAQQSDWLVVRRYRRLYNQLCPCCRRTWSGIVVFASGTQLLPQHVVSATITSSPHVPILVLLVGLNRLGSTDGAHIENLLVERKCIPGLDSSIALVIDRDDLFRVCSGSDHTEAVLLAPFSSGRIAIAAATAYGVPFLLHPVAALGCMSPWNMKLQCLDLVAAFLLVVSSAVCTRQPPTTPTLSRLRLPAWCPSSHVWFLRGSGLM